MTNGWCDFAIRLPGPEWKTGYNYLSRPPAKVGVAIHSMEYESTPEWNDATTLYNALFSDREASWTFSIVWFLNGEALFQHYPIGTVCWAQGYQGNLWLDSIELEDVWKTGGGITEGQYRLLVKTLRWVKEAHEWQLPYVRAGRSLLFVEASKPFILEHNAVPGAPATQCQVFTHGQVDPVRLLADLQEEDMAGCFVQMDGRPEVYQAVGGKLFHVPSGERMVLLSGGNTNPWANVKILSPTDPIWDSPVEYAKVPGELRTP